MVNKQAANANRAYSECLIQSKKMDKLDEMLDQIK